MFRTSARLAVVVTLMLPPAAADADWLFTPVLGPTFGADTFGREHVAYGAALTWRDEEAFGWELDVSHSPSFFEGISSGPLEFTGSGRVTTAMANALWAVGVDDPTLARWQPYLTAGVGLMQMQVVSDRDFRTTTNEIGFNIGGGAMVFAGSKVGMRADLRYVRSFQNQDPSWTRGTDLDIAPGSFDFLRAGIGVVLRFPD